MAIDLEKEAVLGMADAAKALPAVNGHRVAPSSIWRRAREGVQGVYLEHSQLGGRLVTTMRCLNEFAAALAVKGIQNLSPAKGIRTGRPRGRPRSDARRGQEVAAARRRLSEAGV